GALACRLDRLPVDVYQVDLGEQRRQRVEVDVVRGARAQQAQPATAAGRAARRDLLGQAGAVFGEVVGMTGRAAIGMALLGDGLGDLHEAGRARTGVRVP